MWLMGCALQVQAPLNMAPSVEPASPTQYLQVTGMVTLEVLADDVEYNEVRTAPWSPRPFLQMLSAAARELV